MKRPDIKISPRARKVGLWSVGVFVTIGVLGFLAAPPLVRYFAEKKLTELLHRPVTIERVRINPYAMSATVNGFDMKERDGASSALRFDELAVNLEAESLFRGGFVLEEIRLANPALQIVRTADGHYNFSDVIEEILKQPKSDEPTRFSLNNIRLTGGRVDFDDRLLKAKHAVTQIDIGVPFVSNLPSQVEIRVQPTFSARVDGAPFGLGGSAIPFADTRQAVVKLDVDALDLPKYIAYSPVALNFKLPSGKLNTRLTLTFTQPKEGAPSAVVAGDVGLKQVEITEKDGAPLIKLPLVAVKLQSAEIFREKFAVANVRLDHPEVWLARDKDNSIRLVKALSPPTADDDKKAQAVPPARAAAAKPVSFSLAELRLAEGKLHFADAAVAPEFRTDVASLNLVVKNLGNAPNQPATIEADLRTAAGESIRHSGSVTLSPFAAQGHVEMAQAAIARYAPYYGAFLPLRIEDGTLDVATDYSAALPEGNFQFTASKLDLAVKALKLRQPSEKSDFFELAQFAVKDAAIDLAKRSVAVAAVETSGGKLQVRRDKDGSIDLMRMLPAEEKKSARAPAKSPPDTGAVPWSILIGKFNADAYGVRFEDRTLAQPKTVAVEPIQLAAEKISSKLSEPIAIKLKAGVNKRGSIGVDGSVAPEPLKAALKLDVRNIELMPLQPYVADKLTITLTKGALSTRGTLDLARNKSGALSASFRGNAGINNLRTLDSVNATDFLVWKSLFFDGIKLASIDPLRLDIGKVALTDFYSRLILSADGRFNLQQIVRQPEGEGAPAAPTPPAGNQPKAAVTAANDAGKVGAAPAAAPVAPPNYKVTVQQVTLQNGRVNFSDFFVKPNYSADIRQLGGRVAGLSSDLGTTADVELRGEVSDAPLEILGKINPLSGNLFLDLKASAKGIELPQFTPYSSKYAGYAIEKGKLSVDLAYKVENRKLEAQNGVFLDQLTFGDKVESPDATKLPVLLAVSLLKNRRGEIDVKLPIGGSLDDPQFSVGGVIIQVIVNLIAKAVTAPFALLGSMFGGGEELAYVEYDYGLSDITEAAQKKLDILAKALIDRPGLKLEITGRIDPANDREGVKKAVVERKVRAQKLSDLAKKGEAPESEDEVEVGKDEYAKYLERAYKQEKFPKPRNLIGLAKSIPVPEMEKLMLANAPATDDDLRQLAEERAAAVKEYLVDTGKVPAERVFLLAPKLSAAETKQTDKAKEKAKLSRADFSLK